MNVWSGGDYSHNTTGLYSSDVITKEVSSDWSIKGNESFLCNKVSDSLSDLIRIASTSFENGESYTLKMKVLNLSSSSFNVIFFNGSSNQVNVSVPASNDVVPVELTLSEVSTETYLACRLGSATPKFYCDDLTIIHNL